MTTPTPDATAQTCIPPPSGVISWWPGEGNGNDVIGGQNLSTGFAGFPTAKVNLGFDLGGGSMSGPGGNFNMQAPGFTAEFWMKGVHNQPQSLYLVVDKSHGQGGSWGWAFQGDSASGHLGFISGSGSGFDGVDSGSDLLDGVFHHVAGTWDGATLRMYVDGTLKGTAAHTSPVASSGIIEMGNWWATARRYVGLLDELSIYDRALSENEIQTIIVADVAGKCSPCGNGVLNPGEQCDDGNNVAGDCCSPTCQGEAEGTPCASDGVACTLDQCDGTGACTHPSDGTCPCMPRPAGMISWWRAESDATDNSGNNPGSLQGTVSFPPAQVGNGFDFTANGHVQVPHAASLNMTLPGFTAEFWIKGDHNQAESLWDAMDKAHHTAGWAFQGETPNGRMCFHPGSVCASGVDVLDNAFHHIAAAWDGSTTRLYVDGVERASTPQGLPTGNSLELRIGMWQTGSRRFKGVIDETTLYNRALTASQIQGIFSAGLAGKCLGCDPASASPDQCDDGDQCTQDLCNETGTCIHTSYEGPCDDGLFCTVDDWCIWGACKGDRRDCGGDDGGCVLGPCDELTDSCLGDAIQDGNSCDDGDPCTSNDACVAGECAGTPDPVKCFDHFNCEKAKTVRGSSLPIAAATIVDRFGATQGNAVRVSLLCAPADKDAAVSVAYAHPEHLVGYKITGASASPSTVTLRDSIGTHVVTTSKLSMLLLPAVTSLDEPIVEAVPATLDHFACYRIKVSSPATEVSGVTVDDRFGPLTSTLRKPKFLCAAASVNGVGSGAENHGLHLLCHLQAAEPKSRPFSPLYTKDHFRSQGLALSKPSLLCAPAEILP